ncbi:MAG: FtsX-like permease family protein, partial [Nitrospirae bacterium]
MRIPYPLIISLRYFKSKKSEKSISVNTLISIAGVMLGVMALIIVLSVMSGFQQDLRDKILGITAHIYVLSYSGGIKDYDKLIKEIGKIEHVKGCSPFIFGQALLGFRKRSQGVVIRAIEPELEIKTTNLLKNLKEGSIDELRSSEGPPGIIIGSELMKSLGVIPGDILNVISPSGEIGPLGMIPKIKRFKVVGIFEAGMYEYDANLAYIHIKEAQKFFGMGNEVSGIEVKVDDIYKANKIAAIIQKKIGFPYIVKDWMQMNRNLFSALKLEKLAMFVILVLIVLVASFNIVSNLIMIVLEKAREIAILKAMGARDREVMSIFMSYGLIIGVI